jgi:HEAT repeat protein
MGLFGPPNIEKLKAKRNVTALIKALDYKKISTDYKHYSVRQDAAKALGELGDRRAVEPLILALRDENINWRVARALGKIGDARAFDPLLAGLGSFRYQDPFVLALGDLCATVKEPRLCSLAAEPLLSVLDSRDQDLRWCAAVALGKLGSLLEDDALCARLIAALESHLNDRSDNPKKNVYLAAAHSLGMIRTAQAIRHLPAVNEKDAHERMAALAALEQAGVALKDRNDKSAVIEALGMIGPTAVEPLIAVLPEANADQRLAIVTALCELYKHGNLNDKQKAVLLSQKKYFLSHTDSPGSHTDGYDRRNHSDTTCFTGAHVDLGTSTHVDRRGNHADFSTSSIEFPL